MKETGLMTEELSRRAKEQFPLGQDMDQLVLARFHDAQGLWSFYIINQNPDDPDAIFGIVQGTEGMMGFFSLQELQSYGNRFGLQVVRDTLFRPIRAKELWERLNTFN